MKKFALVSGNIVINTVVAESKPEDIQEGTFVEITLETNDPSIGSAYNAEEAKFILPQPYVSWTLNSVSFVWEAPSAKPEGFYRWDENNLSWVEMLSE
jgi:hypothetical protein